MASSYDLIPWKQKQNVVNQVNYEPPLTKDLINLHRDLEQYLRLYPRAYTAIGSLRTRLLQNKKSLEELLRNLRDSKETSKIQQFRQIPLYLQHLFGMISLNYCSHPINYATLVSETQRSDISEVAYITLNYDLFMEDALNKEADIAFNQIENYVPDNKKWMYIKLHGSVNWGRKIKPSAIRNQGQGLPSLLENVMYLNFDTDLENTIEIDDSYLLRPENARFYYPAITVPVDNKYEFNCPEYQINKVKQFLTDCKNFLIIGVSGNDQDLLDLLKDHTSKNVSNITLVGGEHAGETQENFKDGVPQFQTAGWVRYYKGLLERP